MTEPLLSLLARLGCLIGLHGEHSGGNGVPREIGSLMWCLRCGATWQARYDGMAPWWQRRRDLRFGGEERP
jgi:hypothetical protein